MEFRVLGPVELVVGGRRVGVASRRRRHLLAALVARAGQVVPAEQLVDAVWGQDPPSSAGPSLQSHVSRLRTLLHQLDADHDRIITRGGGYRLVLSQGDVIDAGVFEQDVTRAQEVLAGDPERALALVDRALDRWRGLPYIDAREAVPGEVRRLSSIHRSARQVRIEALLALGRSDAVLDELEARLEQEPLDEQAVGQLMVAEFASGRQAAAIEAFHTLRRRLADELGVAPSPWLQERYDALVRQDQDLVAAPQPSTETPAAPPTSLVGRDEATAEVAALIMSERLVTLTGPGGVGKTRLADAVAQHVAGEFDDVITLQLAAIRERASVLAAVATACGVVPGHGTALPDQLVDALRSRGVLLVADNCEHLLPDVAALFEDLVRHCPRLTVLSTSRESLKLPGERRWPVAPLPLPPRDQPLTLDTARRNPAVRLFCERAQAADPSFDPSTDDADTVAEICRRLDGVPLALELAAARVAAFTVQDLSRHLDARFDLLTTGPRHDRGRHDSLRDVVDWSYDLLAPEAADLFERVSVFAGGFTLATAEDVAVLADGDPRVVAAGLGALVDCSMVQRSGARYSVLETLRLYGADRLARRDEARAVRRAHARYFTTFAEQAGRGMRGSDDDAWVPRLEVELDNLRAAHRWAIDAGEVDFALRLSVPLAHYGGWWLIHEVHGWAEAAAELPGAEDHPLAPQALGSAAIGHGNQGQLDLSTQRARQGLALAENDDPARILSLRALSLAAFFEGRLDDSARIEAQILGLAEAADDDYETAYVWLMRSLIGTYQGQYEDGVAAAERAGQQADRLGSTHMQAMAAYCRGEALAPQHPDAALPWLDDAVATARAVGARLPEAVALVTRSSVRAERGDADLALQSFREAIVRLRRGGDWTHQWTTLRNLVFLLARLDAAVPAVELIGAIESASTGAQVYGTDATRLQEITHQLRHRLGDAPFRAAQDRGRQWQDSTAVDAALATIDQLQAAG